ncbi:unnamed protein product, partial [Arabidopsis halleri]
IGSQPRTIKSYLQKPSHLNTGIQFIFSVWKNNFYLTENDKVIFSETQLS